MDAFGIGTQICDSIAFLLLIKQVIFQRQNDGNLNHQCQILKFAGKTINRSSHCFTVIRLIANLLKMNGHLTPTKPIIRVRRESKRSNMGQIQVCKNSIIYILMKHTNNYAPTI